MELPNGSRLAYAMTYHPAGSFFMDNVMNKRPSMQFYPADWLKDPDLQMCSMNTIGIWINLLCRMWESKEEGLLQGKAGELALLAGARPGEFKRFLKEAKEHKFCDVLQDVTESYSVVTIKCRRMNNVFLERERAKRGMRKHRAEQSYENVTPPSSTSSSTSSSKSNKYVEEFEKFRKAYPGTKRGLNEEYNNFQKKHKDWEEVLPLLISALEQQILQRSKDAATGIFVPPWKNLTTWLNQRCWTEQAGIIESPESKKEKEQAELERERETIRKDYEQYYREKNAGELQDCLRVEHINYTHGWLIKEILAEHS